MDARNEKRTLGTRVVLGTVVIFILVCTVFAMGVSAKDVTAGMAYDDCAAKQTDNSNLVALPDNEPATGSGDTASSNLRDARKPRYYDTTKQLLTPQQENNLKEKLDEISERHRFDTVIVVVYRLESEEARIDAADFFERNGFGFGKYSDGAVLLLATKDRDFGFAAFGFGTYAFTPAGQGYLDKIFLPYLGGNQYYKAFMSYADAIDDFLTRAEADHPYNSYNIPLMTPAERSKYRMWAIAISLALALIIASRVTSKWKRQLVSVRKRPTPHADAYIGDFVVTAQKDVLLDQYTDRERRVINNSNDYHTDDHGSSGGSSSSHSSRGGGSSAGSFTTSSGSKGTGHSGKY